MPEKGDLKKMWLLDILFRFNSNIRNMEARRDIKGLARALKYRRDPSSRAEAARALGSIGDTRSVDPLIHSLKDPDRSVRFTAAESLGRIGDARAVQELSDALADKDWYVRLHAATALGDIGNAGAVEPLIRALKDAEKAVREWSARALGSIRDSRALEPLTAVALADKEVSVRDAARQALARVAVRK